MGMFDYFMVDIDCWNCDKQLTEWQTKQLYCLMDCYQIGDYVPIHPNEKFIYIYTNCDGCDKWNEAKVILDDDKLFKATSDTKEDMRYER